MPEFSGVPGSVYDGDTIRVTDSTGKEWKIRFACVDAPERKQPGGLEARDELKRLLELDGNRVKLNIVETDRYGRSVAEVWNGYGLIQSALAGSGLVCKQLHIGKSNLNIYAWKNKIAVFCGINVPCLLALN